MDSMLSRRKWSSVSRNAFSSRAYQLVAEMVEPRDHLAGTALRRQWCRLVVLEVEQRRTVRSGLFHDLVDAAEPARDQQAGAGSLLLEQGIGADCRAMAEVGDGAVRIRVQKSADAFHDRDRRIIGRWT